MWILHFQIVKWCRIHWACFSSVSAWMFAAFVSHVLCICFIAAFIIICFLIPTTDSDDGGGKKITFVNSIWYCMVYDHLLLFFQKVCKSLYYVLKCHIIYFMKHLDRNHFDGFFWNGCIFCLINHSYKETVYFVKDYELVYSIGCYMKCNAAYARRL